MQEKTTPTQLGALTEDELKALSNYKQFQALAEALSLTVRQLVVSGVVNVAVLTAFEEWLRRLLDV